MPRASKGLEEGDIQKLHTTPPEQLTDEELFLSTFCVDDLQRKSSAGWDKQHPKCLFCRKPYRYRTFQVQCHMTSQIKGNTGSQGRVVEVCSMESKKDDGPEKARFLAVRGEIYKRYTAQQKAKDQVASSALKRSITQREEEGEVIEMDGDVTSPSAAKQAHRTLADRLMKRPTVEEFINAWSEAVLGKGLTFDFFSDPLVRKAILVTAQCADSIITFAGSSAKDTLLPKRSTWTQKILPQTDARLQQEAMEILTPIYKEIGCCIMSDGWQSTSNRPILNVIAAADGHVNVRRAFDASGLDKNMPFIADFVMKEIKALGQEHVFSCTMDGACKGAFPIIKHAMPWVQCVFRVLRMGLTNSSKTL